MPPGPSGTIEGEVGDMWKPLTRVITALSAASVFILWIMTFLQVVSRYVVKRPIGTTLEVVGLAFIASIFLGSALVHIEEGHMGFDLVIRSLGAVWNRRFEVVIHAISSVFLLLLLISGMALIQGAWVSKMPLTKISVAWKYIFLPVGAGLMVLWSVSKLASGRAMRRDSAKISCQE